MDSVIYPGLETMWPKRVGNRPESSFIDLSSQNELYQQNLCDRQRSALAVSQSGGGGRGPQQSTSPGGEMNFKEVPVVDNSFSLPRNVFERALATQACVSITAPPSGGFASPFIKDSSAHPISNIQQQRRRTSCDYVTEHTGSEAKRPRLSHPTEEDSAQRMRDKKFQREQFKLQILRRLDHTKDNILKLLKLQHMQGLVNCYEKEPHSSRNNTSCRFQNSEAQYHFRQGSAHERQNWTANSARVQNDPRSVSSLPKGNICVPKNTHGNAQDMHGPPSTPLSLRRVPGINIIKDGAHSNEQKTSYSYKSSDSVGLAWDHKALPKIVAVHSVIRDESRNTAKPASRRPVEAARAAQAKRSYAVGRHGYAHEGSEALQNQLRSPGTSKAVTDCEDDEVVLTKVLPGRTRRSSNSTKRKSVEGNFTIHNESSVVERGRSPNGNQVNRQSFAEYVLDTRHQPRNPDNSGLTESLTRSEHSGHFTYPGHVEHPEHVDRTGCVENHTSCGDSEKIDLTNDNASADCHVTSDALAADVSTTDKVNSQHPGYLQHPGHADSKLYLGGPPPYLPVLNSSEVVELEKERTSPSEPGERRGSNPASPRLTKTIPEISDKIIETRDRIKKETIEWKRKILYSLEKRLMKKLRRAESATGQKSEIEESEKRKKSRSASLDRRSSGEESVTDSVTESVTDSATDDDDDDTLKRSGNLPQVSENVVESGDKRQERLLKDTEDKDPSLEEITNCCDKSSEKCEENKQEEIPCTADEETKPFENSTRVIGEEKVEKCSKELCKEFKEPLNVDDEERNVNLDENGSKVDCVTIEHCQERRNVSETSDTASVNVSQCVQTKMHTNSELSESSHEKSKQPDGNKECVTLACNASEKPRARTENLFEVFSSGFQASPTLMEDELRLPETSEESSLLMTQEKSSTSTETKKPDKPAVVKPFKKDVKILTKLSSLKKLKRLETCSKEVFKKKTETGCCDRNIWAVLQRDGIF